MSLQELHLYAVEKVIEKLEPPLQKDSTNANLTQWLNHVRLSQNTIDLVLSLRSQNKRVIKARYNINYVIIIIVYNSNSAPSEITGTDCVQFNYL